MNWLPGRDGRVVGAALGWTPTAAKRLDSRIARAENRQGVWTRPGGRH